MMIQAVCFLPVPRTADTSSNVVFFAFSWSHCRPFFYMNAGMKNKSICIMLAVHFRFMFDLLTRFLRSILDLISCLNMNGSYIVFHLLRTFLQLVQFFLQFFHNDAWYHNILTFHSKPLEYLLPYTLDSSARMHQWPCFPARIISILTMVFFRWYIPCCWSNLNRRVMQCCVSKYIYIYILAVSFFHTVLSNFSRSAAPGLLFWFFLACWIVLCVLSKFWAVTSFSRRIVCELHFIRYSLPSIYLKIIKFSVFLLFNRWRGMTATQNLGRNIPTSCLKRYCLT